MAVLDLVADHVQDFPSTPDFERARRTSYVRTSSDGRRTRPTLSRRGEGQDVWAYSPAG